MSFEAIIGILMLAALVAGNYLASQIVLRDKYTEQRQKTHQLLAIWLVPIFGTIFVYALHRKPEAPTARYRQDPPPMDDVATSRQVAGSDIDVEERAHASDRTGRA
jgi:hypothetical protein